MPTAPRVALFALGPLAPDGKGNVKVADTRDPWREAADSPANRGCHYNRNAETYTEAAARPGDGRTAPLGDKK
ncbi:MAG: hypothetical protein ACKODX_00980 [Gemmata sp.]